MTSEKRRGSTVQSMAVGESMFCLQLSNILHEHIGRTIAEIGDIDISFTL